MLAAAGYRPPPLAHALVERTRETVCRPEVGRNAVAFVESARQALREFVAKLAERLPTANDKVLTRWLRHARNTTVGGILVCIATHTEVKFGAELDINVGASLADKVKIELVVPQPWSQPAADTLLVGAAAVSVEQTVASARAEADATEHWAWSPVEQAGPADYSDVRRQIEERVKEAQKKDDTTLGFTSSA